MKEYYLYNNVAPENLAWGFTILIVLFEMVCYFSSRSDRLIYIDPDTDPKTSEWLVMSVNDVYHDYKHAAFPLTKDLIDRYMIDRIIEVLKSVKSEHFKKDGESWWQE